MSQIKRFLLEKQEEDQELALIDFDFLQATREEAKTVKEKTNKNKKLEKKNGKSKSSV